MIMVCMDIQLGCRRRRRWPYAGAREGKTGSSGVLGGALW